MSKSTRVRRVIVDRRLGAWEALKSEEKTRHEALFYSQGPIEGLLPGEKARELFLRSNLPLQVLSQVWQIVDVPHDNMLDAAEFSVAMHLIQSHLQGRSVPPELPPCLCLPQDRPPEIRLPQMTRKEYTAYNRLFDTMDVDRHGTLKASGAIEVLQTGGLSLEQLALVWNLAELDRDGRLNADEFALACHLITSLKKGYKVNGPLNIQALLPNKTAKTDLEAKRAKMKELEKRKKALMVLREKRRNEANKEAKRVHLWRERLKLLRIRHQVLHDSADEKNDPEVIEQDEGLVMKTEGKVGRMEVVATRLKKEHERVRQETARTIVDEQRLSEEVKELKEEADKLRQRRKRNSLIKDLDPFHQLYEERKEEKLTGVTVEKEKYEVNIPFKHDPFDPDDLQQLPLCGEDIFLKPNNNNTLQQGPWGDTAPPEPDPSILELTHGFEDDFVELWGGRDSNPRAFNYPGLVGSPNFLDSGEDIVFEEDQDPVFKTVSVTAEEDELWSSIPDAWLSQDERLQYLNRKLSDVADHIAAIEAPQVVFRSESDYVVSAHPTSERQSKWDVLASRRRSTDAHSHRREKEPRSSSEPRQPHHAREHRRSNSDRRKARHSIELDSYREEGGYELTFIDSPDEDESLFFENKTKYKKKPDSLSKGSSRQLRNTLQKAASTGTSASGSPKQKSGVKLKSSSKNNGKINQIGATKSLLVESQVKCSESDIKVKTYYQKDPSSPEEEVLSSSKSSSDTAKDLGDFVVGVEPLKCLPIRDGLSEQSKSIVLEHTSDSENSTLETQYSVDSKEVNENISPKTQDSVNKGNNEETISIERKPPINESVELRNKSERNDRTSRISKAITWYDHDFDSFNVQDIELEAKEKVDSGGIEVRKRQNRSAALDHRFERATSWCASGPVPVPPPRRKSKSPRKVTSKTGPYDLINRSKSESNYESEQEITDSKSVKKQNIESSIESVVSEINNEDDLDTKCPETSEELESQSDLKVTKLESSEHNCISDLGAKPRVPSLSPRKKRQAPIPPETASSCSSKSSSTVTSPDTIVRGRAGTVGSVSSDGSFPSLPTSPERSVNSGTRDRSKRRSAPPKPDGTFSSPVISPSTCETPPIPPPRRSRKGRRPNSQDTHLKKRNRKILALPSERNIDIHEEIENTQSINRSNNNSEKFENESCDTDKSKGLGIDDLDVNIDFEEQIEATNSNIYENVESQNLSESNIEEKLVSIFDHSRNKKEAPNIYEHVEILKDAHLENCSPILNSNNNSDVALFNANNYHKCLHSLETSPLEKSFDVDIGADNLELDAGCESNIDNSEISCEENTSKKSVETDDNVDNSNDEKSICFKSKCDENIDFILNDSNDSSDWGENLISNITNIKINLENLDNESSTDDFTAGNPVKDKSETPIEESSEPDGSMLAYKKSKGAKSKSKSNETIDSQRKSNEDPHICDIDSEYYICTPDDLSLLVEHGYDIDIMDAASRKRELDKLRAQFFKPPGNSSHSSAGGSTVINVSSSPIPSYGRDSNSATFQPKDSHSYATYDGTSYADDFMVTSPQKTVIKIGGDDDFSIANNPVLSNTTTISVGNDFDAINDNKSHSQVALANSESQELKTNVDINDSIDTVQKSRIVLDLNDQQDIPAFESCSKSETDEIITADTRSEEHSSSFSSKNINKEFKQPDSWYNSALVGEESSEQLLHKNSDSWDESLDKYPLSVPLKDENVPCDLNTDNGKNVTVKFEPNNSTYELDKYQSEFEEDVVLVSYQDKHESGDLINNSELKQPTSFVKEKEVSKTGDISDDIEDGKEPDLSWIEIEKDMATRTHQVHTMGSPVITGTAKKTTEQKIAYARKIREELNLESSKDSQPKSGKNKEVTHTIDVKQTEAPPIGMDLNKSSVTNNVESVCNDKVDKKQNKTENIIVEEIIVPDHKEQKPLFSVESYYSAEENKFNTENSEKSNVTSPLVDFGSSKDEDIPALPPTPPPSKSFGTNLLDFDPFAIPDDSTSDVLVEPSSGSSENYKLSTKQVEHRPNSPQVNESSTLIAVGGRDESKGQQGKVFVPFTLETKQEELLNLDSPSGEVVKPKSTTVNVNFAPSSYTYEKSQVEDKKQDYKKSRPKDIEIKSDEQLKDEHERVIQVYSRAVNKDVPKSVTSATITLQSPSSPRVLSPTFQDQNSTDDMDPVTGLRKTSVSTPLEKAMQFIQSQDTEPNFKITRKNSRNDEIEAERMDILNESRIKKKTMDRWLSNEETFEDDNKKVLEVTDSQKKYEERKKQTITVQLEKPKTPTNVVVSKADIDQRSITDQKEKTKEQWERQFSSSDTRLFPPEQPSPQPREPVTDFISSVAEESIGDLRATKQQWEQKYQAEQEDSNRSTSVPGYNESAIDREIRLAQQRDEELRREQKQRLQSQREKADFEKGEKQEKMPIHKVASPKPSTQSPVTLVHSTDWSADVRSPQPAGGGRVWDMTEADRDVALRVSESIIEKEIRDQQEREFNLKKEGVVKSYQVSPKSHEKEQEQSLYEEKEKDQLRVSAHESVIEREIREQQEREREIQRLRQQQSAASPPPQQQQAAQAETVFFPREEPQRVEKVEVQRVEQKPALQVRIPPATPPPTHQASPQARPPPRQSASEPRPPAPAKMAAERAGESLIEREMREQQEREDELRTHWRELGMEVGTQEPPDTPYNRPDPHPAMGGGRQGFLPRTTHSTVVTSYSQDVSPFKSDGYVAHQRRGSVESADSSRGSSDRLESRPQVKVQPYVLEDEEVDGAQQFVFSPQSETPVEREIRLAREREEALRRERGLPYSQDTVDGGRQVSVEVTSSQPRHRQASTPEDKTTMKRFASSRLQHELEREKQRELMLRSEGKISTTSHERGTGPGRYKDLMQDDGRPPPMPTAQAAPAPRVPSYTPESRVANGNSPGVPINRPRSQVYEDSRGAPAESRIEQELREQREREEELRRERELLSGGGTSPAPPTTNGDVSGHYQKAPPKSQSMDAIQHRPRQQNAAESAGKTHRRKSALAEQWEKKFGASG